MLKMNEWIQKATDSLTMLHKEEENLKYALEKIVNTQEEEADFTDVEHIDLTTKVRRICSKCKEYFYLDTPRAKHYKYCPYCGVKIGIISENNQIFAPKILSIDEILKSPVDKVLWLERRDFTKVLIPINNPHKDYIPYGEDHGEATVNFNDNAFFNTADYNKTWRCWDNYANSEQRGKESWLN